MFNSIRKTIANLIAPSSINVQVPAGTKSLTIQQIPEHVRTQAARAESAPMRGDFHVSHLDLLSSTYLKNAIANLGSWSALARGFAAYEQCVARPRADRTKLETAINEFHCWNASLPTEKQMEGEEILLTLDRLATVAIPKGDNNTDAIIARVRKCSVDELKADRLAQAAKQSAFRQELILGYVAELNNYSDEDFDPSLPIVKAAGKVLQTMEWVATKWQGEPAGIAAELLLIEADQRIIEAMAKAADEKSYETSYEPGHRKFGDERNENTKHVQDDVETKRLDYAAYQAWVAEQKSA